MALGYAKIGEHERDRLRGHRAAAIGMNRQLRGVGTLLLNRRLEQQLCKLGALAVGDHPTDDVSAIDVNDDVKIVVGPFLRSVEFGNVGLAPISWTP